MKTKTFKLMSLLAFVALFSTGCVTIKGNSTSTATQTSTLGGVYKTANIGDTWVMKHLVPTTDGKPKSISAVDTATFVSDPSDPKAYYLGTYSQGLVYTLDAGESWTIVKTLGQGTVRSLAVDPNNKCIIYATFGNRLMKSVDCTRTWNPTYFDNDQTTTVSSVAMEPGNSRVLYLGTDKGAILKSIDSGESWQQLLKVTGMIDKIFVHPMDAKIVYVTTPKNGLRRSVDSGRNWSEIKITEVKDGANIRDLAISNQDKGLIYLATNNNILKSADNGDTWTKINLLTESQTGSTINALAVNYKNPKEIFYLTNFNFYRTDDGGVNWTPKKIGTTRAGWKLYLNQQNPKELFMGVRALSN